MVSKTLSLWENGAVTLPKAWLKKYGTKHFLAKENEKGYLVIMPILDMEYYEEKDGSFGLRFPTGIEADELLALMKEANKKIDAREKNRKKKSRPSRNKKHG